MNFRSILFLVYEYLSEEKGVVDDWSWKSIALKFLSHYNSLDLQLFLDVELSVTIL
ncbi:MAG TPA: hypothetical protein VIQ04_07575 [Nitrososphaeraceae archaeon]|jgi:hypothetical protein